jgi:hypothetical protein
VTLAFGTTEFVGSVTVPRIEPVEVWDQAAMQVKTTANRILRMFTPLASFQ